MQQKQDSLCTNMVCEMSGSVTEANSRYVPKHSDKLIHQLRIERIRRGWSQQALAVTIGVHTNEVHRWENKHHLPNADTFIAWLEALDFKIVPPDIGDYEI
jgi:ribosome-binding protein aMBF1 (putative translation factor)